MSIGYCGILVSVAVITALLTAEGQAATGLRAEVKPHRGALCLFINGEPWPGLMGNASPGGDVRIGEGQCVVEALDETATKTARRFAGDLVVECKVTFLEPRSETDSSASLVLETDRVWYYLSLSYDRGKNTARFWKWIVHPGKFDLLATLAWDWKPGEEHQFRLQRARDVIVGTLGGREVSRDQGADTAGEAVVALAAYRGQAAFRDLRVSGEGKTLFADRFDQPPRSGRNPNWRGVEGSYVRDVARAGVNLLTVTVRTADYWVAEAEYRFDRVDAAMRMTHRQHPRALMLVRFVLQPPGWWLERHPEECSLTANRQGEMFPQKSPSPSSRLYREVSAAALQALLRHWGGTEINDYLMGYALLDWAAGEWTYGWNEQLDDYSPRQKEGFAAWLKERYRTEEELKTAWKRPVTFATVEIPSPDERLRRGKVGELFDPAGSLWVRDYLEYHSHIMAAAVMATAHVCKSEAPDKLCGFPYGYHLLDGFQPASYHNTGHRALAEVLACPDVDFLFSPYGYRERDPGGLCLPLIPVGSLNLHHKLYYYEDDTRTSLSAAEAGYGRCDTSKQSVDVLWRNAAAALAETGHLWWMDWGWGWYDDPAMQAAMKRMQAVSDEALRRNRTRNAEIAVLFSDRSLLYFRAGERLVDSLLTRQMREVGRLGAPFDMYLITDLERMPAYKLYLFADTLYLSEAERQAIRQRVLQPGKTALWLYATGVLSDEGMSAEKASEVTGIGLGLDASTACPLEVVLTHLSHPLTKGLPPGLRFGTELNLAPVLWCQDAEATVLGSVIGIPSSVEQAPRWWNLCKPGLAVKQVNGAHSIWCSAPNLPACLLRNVARYAGVHIYDDQEDALYANSSFLAIHTRHGGERLLRLPRKSQVTDAMTGEVLARQASEFRVTLGPQETGCWWVE